MSCCLSCSNFCIKTSFSGFFFFLVEMPDPFPNVTFGNCCKAATNLLFSLVLILVFKVVHGSLRSAKRLWKTTSVMNIWCDMFNTLWQVRNIFCASPCFETHHIWRNFSPQCIKGKSWEGADRRSRNSFFHPGAGSLARRKASPCVVQPTLPQRNGTFWREEWGF